MMAMGAPKVLQDWWLFRRRCQLLLPKPGLGPLPLWLQKYSLLFGRSLLDCRHRLCRFACKAWIRCRMEITASLRSLKSHDLVFTLCPLVTRDVSCWASKNQKNTSTMRILALSWSSPISTHFPQSPRLSRLGQPKGICGSVCTRLHQKFTFRP